MAAPALKVALCAFRDEPLSEEEELRWLWLACRIARALADDGAWEELTARHLELARRTGAFSLLPVALTDRVVVELIFGRFGVATSLAAESDAVVEATGSRVAQRTSITLANWRGRDAEAVALIGAREHEVLRRGEGLWVVANEWGSAQRYNALGRYEDALAAAEWAAQDPRGLGPSIWVLAELIEAAVRSDQAPAGSSARRCPTSAQTPYRPSGQCASAASSPYLRACMDGPLICCRLIARERGGRSQSSLFFGVHDQHGNGAVVQHVVAYAAEQD